MIDLAELRTALSNFTQHEVEKQIREEFQAAFDEVERASGEEKAGALERLNRATRRLYDFVGHGRIQEFQRRRRSNTQ